MAPRGRRTANHRSVETLHDGEKLLSLILRNFSTRALLVLDPAGKVVKWGAGAEQLFGYRADEVVDKPYSFFFPALEGAAGVPEQELQAARERGVVQVERWTVRKNGERFRASAVVSSLRDEEGHLLGFGLFVEDASQRQRVLEELALRIARERQARNEAKRDQRRLLSILERITDGFLSIEKGRITYVNLRATEILGRSSKMLLGKSLREALPEVLYAWLFPEYIRCLDHQVEVVGDVYYPPMDAWLEIHLYPSKHGATVFINDVTQRKIIELELQQRERRRAAIAQLGVQALAIVDLDVLFNAAVTLLSKILEVDLSGIFDLVAEEGALRLRAGIGWKAGLVGTVLVAASRGSLMGYALQRREAVVVEDLATEKRFRPPALLPEHGVVSGATIAIPGRERPLGVLGVYTTRRRTFSPDDIYVLEAVTNILALAVRRVTAEREQAQLLASEQAARAQAEQARRRQEIFMAVVAHDLRGPLTAIRGYAQLLKRFETLSSERRAQAISTILGEVDRLNRLIGDLLDFSRVVAGRLRIAPRPVDLVGLARQVVEAQQMTTAAHQLILDAPPRVQGIWDPDRLAQVLTNLVSNAIKYSPEGGNVWVRLRPLDDEVEISVTDQGVGMTPEERARPFEPFARLERTRSLKGVGLGLFIAKGIVEAHGGRIWAESAGPGKGSTFFVTLPRRPPGKL